jgi:hypothetical protein
MSITKKRDVGLKQDKKDTKGKKDDSGKEASVCIREKRQKKAKQKTLSCLLKCNSKQKRRT